MTPPGTRRSALPSSPQSEIPTSCKGWHRRGYLPHFDAGRVQQSITYRLHDALPKSVLENFQAQVASEPDEVRQRHLRRLMETYADAGHGACELRSPEAAQIVIDAWRHRDGVSYDLISWVVMPNHVHVLINQYNDHPLERIVARWKSFTATMINKTIGRTGTLWMPDYWDRYIRDEDHFRRVVDYIHNNPVRAGLVNAPNEWPWSSAS